MAWIALLRPKLELPSGFLPGSLVLYKVLDILLNHTEIAVKLGVDIASVILM